MRVLLILVCCVVGSGVGESGGCGVVMGGGLGDFHHVVDVFIACFFSFVGVSFIVCLLCFSV